MGEWRLPGQVSQSRRKHFQLQLWRNIVKGAQWRKRSGGEGGGVECLNPSEPALTLSGASGAGQLVA